MTLSLSVIGSRGRVIGWLGRSIMWFGRFIIMGYTFVFHISDKSIISIDSVVHSLSAAIGKEDVVVSLGVIAITMFFSSKMNWGIAIVILDSISIVVNRMGIFILGLMVRGSVRKLDHKTIDI